MSFPSPVRLSSSRARYWAGGSLLLLLVGLGPGCSASDAPSGSGGSVNASGGSGGTVGDGGGSGGLAASGGTTSGGASAGGASGTGGDGAGGAAPGDNKDGSGGAPSGDGGAPGGAGGSTGSGYPHGVRPTTISDDHLAAAWSRWKENWVETCPGGAARVIWDQPENTVSEGIGYGMLGAVGNDDRELFDGFWKYYQQNVNERGVMHWKRGGCEGTKPDDNSDNGASDAELDVAMALIQAECKWKDAKYGTDADALISRIFEHETVVEGGLRLLKPGDAFGGADCQNASYFAPAYYRLFAERPAQAARKNDWLKLASDSYVLLERFAHPTTGFVPNWSDANGNTSTSGPSGCNWYTDAHIFGTDAIRTPFRIAVDYLLFGTPEAKTWLNRVTDFVDSQDITKVGRKFNLDGTPYGEIDHSIISVGAFANAAMASTQDVADRFALEAVTVDDHKYFPDSLRVLYFLVLTGRFTPCAE